MNNYVHFDKVQKELKKKDTINCFGAQLCITISLTIYIAILIVYMCLIVDPPRFVYILLTVVIFGNSLIASFSLMNICRKRQSYFLWKTIYLISICFVNSINVGLVVYVYKYSIYQDPDSVLYFGFFLILVPSFICLLALIINLTCLNPLCNDNCKKYCIKELNDYNEV